MADSIVADEGEVLDDGLVEDTPDGDNLLLDFLRADAAAFRAQAAAVGGRLAHDPDLGLYLADTSSPSVFGNVADLYRPVTDPGRARAVAERLTAFYGDAPGGAALVFSVVPTPDLSPYGLQPVGHPPLMVREPGLAPPPLPPGLSVEVVADLPALEAFESAFVQGYPVPGVRRCAPRFAVRSGHARRTPLAPAGRRDRRCGRGHVGGVRGWTRHRHRHGVHPGRVPQQGHRRRPHRRRSRPDPAGALGAGGVRRRCARVPPVGVSHVVAGDGLGWYRGTAT